MFFSGTAREPANQRRGKMAPANNGIDKHNECTKHNIRAEIRIKPAKDPVLDISGKTIKVNNRAYSFDKIHAKVSQKNLFLGSAMPFIESFLSGYSVSIMAYGQTGSGKTYTMGICPSSVDGMVQYSLRHIFSKIASLASSNSSMDGNESSALTLSFIEIYNEEIYDLLSSSDGICNSNIKTLNKIPLNLRQVGKEANIVGMREVPVHSLEEALSLLNIGCTRRTSGSTEMNSISSRSHAIFSLTLAQPLPGSTAGCDSKMIISKINFVDLAGSERMKRTNCRGSAARESININTGLLALGNVISALYTKKGYIPYRDSKLTRILQDSLKNNMLLIGCVSPQQIDINETINTLKYSSRASCIDGGEIRIAVDDSKDRREIRELRKEISALKAENQRYRAALSSREASSIAKLDDIHKKSISNENNNDINNDFSKDIKYENNDIYGHPLVKDLLDKIKNLERTVEILKGNSSQNACSNENNLNYEGIKSHISNSIDTAVSSAKKRKRLVSFDLNKQPSVFTPKKEMKILSFERKLVLEYNATAMDCNSERMIFVALDGKVWEYKENKIRYLFADEYIKNIRIVEKHNNKSLDKESIDSINIENIENKVCSVMSARDGNNKVKKKVIYSTKSLLKQHFVNENTPDSSSGKTLLYAYKSNISYIFICGSSIITGHEDGYVNILDGDENKIIYSEKLHAGGVLGIEKVCNRIYSCSRDHTIRYVELASVATSEKTGRKTDGNMAGPPHYDAVCGLQAFQNRLISYSRDCSIKVWDDDRCLKTVSYAHEAGIKTGAILRDCWVTACKKGGINAWGFINKNDGKTTDSGERNEARSVRLLGNTEAESGINCISGSGDELWVAESGRIALYKITRK
ncbi:hypothetical protein ENBRE01_0319 [Enteropsectra breve]|nr:hypothetical protein ENBRE01_0319 [Enteropsectra breve]